MYKLKKIVWIIILVAFFLGVIPINGLLGENEILLKVSASGSSTGMPQVSSSSEHRLLLTSAGDLFSWGKNTYGELGNGTFQDSDYTQYIGSGFSKISVGLYTSLALDNNGNWYAWGLGFTSAENNFSVSNVPKLIGTGFSQISAGNKCGYGIKSNGDLYAWGSNNVLLENISSKHVPNLVGTGFSKVSANDHHVLALKSNGELYSWGKNGNGQLGDGSKIDSTTPKLIGTGFSEIDAGLANSLAIKTNGDMFSWGWGGGGQIGDGTFTERLVPTFIGTGFSKISVGARTSCAIKQNGDLYSWGHAGSYENRILTPRFYDSDYVSIEAANRHFFAIKSDKLIYGYGNPYISLSYGSWGNGSKEILSSLTPLYNIDSLSKLNSTPANNTGITSNSTVINEQISIEERMIESPESLENDPIDTASGAQLINRTLLSVKGVIPISFSINYNSLLLNSGIIGKGWNHNFEGNLIRNDANNLTINWGANNKSKYRFDGSIYKSNNAFTPYDSVSVNESNNYTLKKQDGTKYLFDSTGKMIQIINDNGQSLILAYNDSNKLITVTELISGKKISMTYDTLGRLTTVYDDLNRTLLFKYDSNNNLNSVTDACEYVTNYTFNTRGQILSCTDSESRNLFVNEFDTYGRVIKQSDSLGKPTLFGYDEVTVPGKIVTTVIDRLGNTKKLTHDANYHLLSTVDELGYSTNNTFDSNGNKTQVIDSENGITNFTYDERGNILTATNSQNQSTSFTYDSNDNLLRITYADENVKNFIYDAQNNLLTEKDSLENVTTFTYNANSPVISKKLPEGGISNYTYVGGLLTQSTDATGVNKTFSYDGAGRTLSVADKDGNATNFVFDNNDNITQITNPLGQSVHSVFDGYGNKLSQIDALGNTTDFTYNNNGKIKSVTDAFGNSTQFTYDAEDRLTAVLDKKGNKTAYVYDAKGRKIETIDAIGNKISISYDKLDRVVSVTDALGSVVSSNEYDSIGNLLSSTDALGRVTSRLYDNLNRITEEIDPLTYSTKMVYDTEGKLIKVTDPKNQSASKAYNKNGQVVSVTDSGKKVTNFEYDVAGRLISQTKSSGAKIISSYNTLGQLESVVNGKMQTSNYTYDDSGRVVSMKDPVSLVIYSYDASGKVTSITDSKGTLNYIYDSLNRVTQYTDTNGNIIKYAYDVNGNLTGLTYPDNKVVTYEYDVLNRMTKVTDWAGRVTSYAYDADSRLVTATAADGSVVTYSYDAMSQMLSQRDVDKNGNVIAGYKFAYDNDGNVTKESSTISKSISALTAATMTYGIGNQASTFNGQNLVFDADGNMTTGPVKGTMGALTYDARNRLLTAGGMSYDYDAFGNRISVTEAGVKTTDVVNPLATLSQTLVEKDASGNAIAYYVYGLGLVGMQTADSNYYTYHYDRRGSTVALTKADGVVTDKYSYGTFGEVLSKSGTTRNQFLYDGRDGVVTDSNGLYYMRARYYSTDIKRFVNEDTVLGGIMNGQSLNRFAYVNGNPVSMVDPLGLCGEKSNKINDPSVWGSFTNSLFSSDSYSSYLTGAGEYASGRIANKIYGQSVTASSRVEAYTKLFDNAIKAEKYRKYVGYAKTAGKFGGAALSGISGGIDVYSDIKNPNFTATDRNKAVFVDVLKTGATIGGAIAVGALLPVATPVLGVIAAGVGVSLVVDYTASLAKEWWIDGR